MAIFHLSRSIIGGKAGGSAVMASGYSHGRKVTHELKQVTKSYEFKHNEVVHEVILLPKDAPQWAVDRYVDADVGAASERLWNDIEKREQRSTQWKTAQQAQFYNISLPVELSRSAQIELIEDFARNNLMSNGEIVDITIHDMGDGNPHAHIMQTLRPLGPSDFENKIRGFQTARLELLNIRAAWALAANAVLEREGFEARIDHRSNLERGLELVPGTTFNADIANMVEKNGGIYRAKVRAMEAREANEFLLMGDPDLVLMVLSQEKPRFMQDDIEAELRRKLPPDVRAADVSKLVMRALASPELVALGEADHYGKPIYTTRTALEMGRMLTRSTLQMRDSEVDLGQADPSPEPDPSLELSVEQTDAFRAMVSPRRIEVIEGYAGTGKTRTLIEASKVWEDRGFAVYGSAVSGKAVQELSALHGHKGTIAHFEQLWEAGGLPPEDKFVMFMDEASMVGVSTWARFQDRINTMGGVIRVIGDRAQTTPVNDASALAHVASLTGVTSITEIRRQQGEAALRGDREAIRAISQSIAGVGPALEHFASEGVDRIKFSENAADAKFKIVERFFEGTTSEQFWTKGHERLAIAHTNADVDDLNEALHQKARALGFASKRKDETIQIDRTREGKKPITISKGDRIRFTQPYSDLDISKNSLGRIEWVSGSIMSVKVDGRAGVVEIDTAKVSDFDYGYAVTIHKSQGASINGKVFGMLTGMVDWHLLDVLLSRHILDLEIHVPADNFGMDYSAESVGTSEGEVQRAAILNKVIAQVSRSGLAPVVGADVTPTLRRAHLTVDEVLTGARADRVAGVTDGPSDIEVTRVSLVNDTHLFQISQRTAGLLRGEFKENMDSEFKSDPRGYIVDPLKVVDDLLAENGVVRAADVASRLSEVTADPASFSQLFYRAMAHPDLVILSEGGIAGEGRIYSTVAHIDQATSVMDQAMRLAVQQSAFSVPLIYPKALSVPGNHLRLESTYEDYIDDLVCRYHAIVTGQPVWSDKYDVLTGGGVAAPQVDWTALRSVVLEQSIAKAIRDYGLEADKAAALRSVLWPARIGIIEAIGSDHGAEVIAATAAVLGREQVISVHPSQVIASQAAAAYGGTGYTLHSLGADLKEGHLTLGPNTILYVPDASGLAIDQIEILMGQAEKSGAKLVLHRDPTVEATGSVLRHLADRLPVSQVGGLSAIDPKLQGLVQGGDALERSISHLWTSDCLMGAQSERQQIAEFVDSYFESDAARVIGLASSGQMRALLNEEMEKTRHDREGGRNTTPIDLDRGPYSKPIKVSVGTRLVLTRDVPSHKLMIGDQRIVNGFTDSGDIILGSDNPRVPECVLSSGLEASALEYGYVVSPQMALRANMQGDEVRLFATRGLKKPDLLAALQIADHFSVSLPTEVNQSGAAQAFFERALSRQPRGTILDYGFDPSKAMYAAGEAYHAPTLDERMELSAENRAVLDETRMVYRTNPEFIIADLARKSGRFDVAELATELRSYYSGAELDVADRRDLALTLIQQFEADGSLIQAGLSDINGAQRYTTRVQAEIEIKAIEQGRSLAAKALSGVAPHVSDNARLAHVAGADRLSLAVLPASVDAQRQFYRDLGQVWRDRGYKIIATDMSKASSTEQADLLGEGTTPASWTSLDVAWAAGRVPNDADKTVLVVSGSETIPATQYARLQDKADQLGMKIIALAGDHDLPRSNSLNVFKALSGEVGAYRDTPALIQTREADRIAVTLMAGNAEDAARAIAIHDGLGHVHFAGARTSAVQSIARRYWREGPASDVSRLAFAHSRANVQKLDEAIRAEGKRLGHLGEEVTFGDWTANIGQQLRLSATIQADLNEGESIQLIGASLGGITVYSPATSDTHFIPDFQLGEVQPSFARTLWEGTDIEVDKSFVLATYGMDQSLFKVALSRHRDDIEVHAAERDFRGLNAMQRAASQRHDLVALKESLQRQEASMVEDPALQGRRDRTSPIYKTGVYAQDAHLQMVAQRVSALMEIGRDPFAPVLSDDPNGYAIEPRKVVDDILAQSSVLRAEDVARRLSSVVRDPKTFERLFAEAMTHPDLVILSEEGRNGEGRVYSTLAQIKLEMSIHDRVTALSLTDNGLSVSQAVYQKASITEHGPMTVDQDRALRHVTSGARISLINGVAGSGKSTVFAGAREIYEQAGWQVIGAALTVEATRSLAEASGIQSRTVTSLLNAAENDKLPIGPKTALVIDRAGLMDANLYDAVISLVEKSGASLMLADTSEHIQYGAGGMFRQLSQSLGSTTLGHSQRQRDPQDAQAVKDLARGGDAALDAVRSFDDRGMIVATGRDREASLSQIVEAFTADQSEDKVIVALRRVDVEDLNLRARHADQMSRDPALPDQLVTDADGNTLSLQAGDKVRVAISSHSHGIYKGELGEVAHVNPEAETYTLQMGKGDEARYVTLPFEGGPSLSYGYAQTIDTAAGVGRQSVHAVLDGATGRDRSLTAMGLHTHRLAVYTPTEADEAVPFLNRVVTTNTQRVTTLEREYGFDPSRSAETLQETRADQMSLADYLAANEVPEPRPARSKLADFFKPDASREGLAPAAPIRALTHVRDARAVEGDMVMDGAIQHHVTRLLQDVSDEKTWVGLSNRLSRAERQSVDLTARRWTNAPEGETLLPEARALARAIAYSDKCGTHEVTRSLKAGMEALSIHVEEARATGSYEQMLKDAHAPVAETRELAPVGVAQGPSRRGPRSDPYRSDTRRSRSFFAEIKAISDREYARAKEKTEATLRAREEAAKEKERAAETHTSPMEQTGARKAIYTFATGKTPMEHLDDAHGEPATTGHKDVWERYALDEQVRETRYEIRDFELFREAEKDLPEWTGPHTAYLVKRKGSVQSNDIDRYMSKAGKDVPKAWVERHRERLLTLGTAKPSPEFKSVAEFRWALSYTAEQNVLQPEGYKYDRIDPTSKVIQQDDWFSRNLRHNLVKTGEINQTFSREEGEWMGKVYRYIERTEYVPLTEVRWRMEQTALDYDAKGLPELEKENVPIEWKERLTQIVTNRHNPTAQPGVKSAEEFVWASRLLASVSTSRSLGRAPEPSDIAPKISGPSSSPDLW